jgi:iron complex outermembrane receptor protein
VSDDAYSFDGGGIHSSAAAILHWRPAPSIEIIPFWSGFIHHGMDTPPAILVAPEGNFLPPEIKRGRYIAQPWSRYKGHDANYGAIARWKKGSVSIASGAFRSVSTTQDVYSDLFTNVSPAGVSQRHLIFASPPQKYGSTSGELRGSYFVADGSRAHTFHVAARARDRKRRYGGSSAADLGPIKIDEILPSPEPEFTYGLYTNDRVRQLAGGIGYDGRWSGVGELTLGLQKVFYRKEVSRPGQTDPATRASPWLYNAGAALFTSPSFAIYGGLTRGLEESPVAPATAVNRDEAPPAILTFQYDGGIRWAVTPKLRLVAGLFNVEKPYFSLDNARIYRRLGQVRHRGAELSIVGEVTPRLNLLAGAVFLHARVSGEEVEVGAIGSRPVGSAPRTLLFSADYRLPWVAGLSANISVNSIGKRTANSANTVFVPATETVGLGMRYQSKVGKIPVALRMNISNLFNEYSWNVLASNAYFYNNQRQLSISLAADF